MKEFSYAETLRKAMRAKGYNRRDLERMTGFSYEHVRKIVSGYPLQSEKFNEELCKALGLDADEMWKMAQREKMKRNGKAAILSSLLPPDNRLRTLWPELEPEDHERIYRLAEGLVEERRAQRAVSQTEDPARIREEIGKLMDKLQELGGAPIAVRARAQR